MSSCIKPLLRLVLAASVVPLASCAATPQASGAADYERGLDYASEGRFDEAIASYSNAVRLEPKQADYYLDRGIAFFSTGDYDRAIDDFDSAISLKRDFVAAISDRGAAYIGKRDYEKAIRDLNRAIELRPDLYSAWVNRGQAHFSHRDYQNAVTDYGRALQLHSAKPAASRYLWDSADAGIMCRMKALVGNALFGALEDCNEALQQSPNYAPSYQFRALVYLRLGEDDQAIADASRAIELDQSMSEAFVIRGAALRRAKDTHGSDRDLSHARAMNVAVDDLLPSLGVTP